MTDKNTHDHDDDDEELDEEFEVYDVDEQTRVLIETACNCMISLAEAQIHEDASRGLRAIADALAERFAIDAIELEEHHHVSEEGEETILAPKGGVFPDADSDEAEGPAPE